jgi:hypothetical protein
VGSGGGGNGNSQFSILDGVVGGRNMDVVLPKTQRYDNTLQDFFLKLFFLPFLSSLCRVSLTRPSASNAPIFTGANAGLSAPALLGDRVVPSVGLGVVENTIHDADLPSVLRSDGPLGIAAPRRVATLAAPRLTGTRTVSTAAFVSADATSASASTSASGDPAALRRAVVPRGGGFTMAPVHPYTDPLPDPASASTGNGVAAQLAARAQVLDARGGLASSSLAGVVADARTREVSTGLAAVVHPSGGSQYSHAAATDAAEEALASSPDPDASNKHDLSELNTHTARTRLPTALPGSVLAHLRRENSTGFVSARRASVAGVLGTVDALRRRRRGDAEGPAVSAGDIAGSGPMSGVAVLHGDDLDAVLVLLGALSEQERGLNEQIEQINADEDISVALAASLAAPGRVSTAATRAGDVATATQPPAVSASTDASVDALVWADAGIRAQLSLPQVAAPSTRGLPSATVTALRVLSGKARLVRVSELACLAREVALVDGVRVGVAGQLLAGIRAVDGEAAADQAVESAAGGVQVGTLAAGRLADASSSTSPSPSVAPASTSTTSPTSRAASASAPASASGSVSEEELVLLEALLLELEQLEAVYIARREAVRNAEAEAEGVGSGEGATGAVLGGDAAREAEERERAAAEMEASINNRINHNATSATGGGAAPAVPEGPGATPAEDAEEARTTPSIEAASTGAGPGPAANATSAGDGASSGDTDGATDDATGAPADGAAAANGTAAEPPAPLTRRERERQEESRLREELLKLWEEEKEAERRARARTREQGERNREEDLEIARRVAK